jgi:hypothetical protein
MTTLRARRLSPRAKEPNGTENVVVLQPQVNLVRRRRAGSNAGTRVRVSNVGGAPLSLGAPRVTGTDANDFDVELEIAPLRTAAAARAAGPGGLSPLLESSATAGRESASRSICDHSTP